MLNLKKKAKKKKAKKEKKKKNKALFLSWHISVPSFIVRGPTINMLEAQTQFTSYYCLRLFLKIVISVLMNSYHGTSVLLCEDQL